MLKVEPISQRGLMTTGNGRARPWPWKLRSQYLENEDK